MNPIKLISSGVFGGVGCIFTIVIGTVLLAIQGQRVKLIYEQKLVADFSKGSTNYHVVGFELVK